MPTPETAAELLTLKSMRALVTVARAGSVTRASAELGLAQSAVSRQVGEMERALGGPLFHRTGRGLQPTDLGAEVLPRIETLLEMAEELARSSRERACMPSGIVTLGLVPGVAGFLASALYREVATQYPQVRLRILEGYSGDMETALTQGRLDLAVLNRYRAEGSNSYRRLFEAQLCVVGRREVLARFLGVEEARHGDAGWPASLPLQSVAGIPLVLPIPPNAIRNLLDEQTRGKGIAANVILEAGSSTIVMSMLREHECASVLPPHAIADELGSGRFSAVPLAERAFRQHVVLATSSQRPFTLASKMVAGLIPGVVNQLGCASRRPSPRSLGR
ncbi:LysR family transcriptional regulator [Paraburkholderia susongensis]|uniref:DNA-binding transcriptional regulator, LysR family n=1 Tax=Paraburkholderia susongensis TaxID=1515439 RepID=A0A1X7M0M5_9BURK|nr:LysR family transcriptional regulator [Paraburkholderia susongensis]SMG59520.1 DNA-binding transcriptional regulator, LysR family [Paraburkholderia susongensis]